MLSKHGPYTWCGWVGCCTVQYCSMDWAGDRTDTGNDSSDVTRPGWWHVFPDTGPEQCERLCLIKTSLQFSRFSSSVQHPSHYWAQQTHKLDNRLFLICTNKSTQVGSIHQIKIKSHQVSEVLPPRSGIVCPFSGLKWCFENEHIFQTFFCYCRPVLFLPGITWAWVNKRTSPSRHEFFTENKSKCIWIMRRGVNFKSVLHISVLNN